MQRHAYAHRSRLGPWFGIEGALRVDAGGDRGGRVGESGLEGIPDRLEVVPPVGTDGRGQDGVMPLERDPHRLPVALPEPRRALDVGEEKGDHPRGRSEGDDRCRRYGDHECAVYKVGPIVKTTWRRFDLPDSRYSDGSIGPRSIS